MQRIHTPRIDARYWIAITLASVFGTNMGDFYAHEAHLGLGRGLAVLALLAAIVFLLERFIVAGRETYYWLVIILIRTGATNIADFLLYRARIPGLVLTLSLLALIALFAWGTYNRSASQAGHLAKALPETNAAYWLAMLSAGVFGTVAGDLCEHGLGDGVAAIVLSILLLVVLLALGRRAAQVLALYWTTIAVARTAGTAIGDWFAENKLFNIGLPVCTLLSGIAFLAVLVFWRSARTTTVTAPR